MYYKNVTLEIGNQKMKGILEIRDTFSDIVLWSKADFSSKATGTVNAAVDTITDDPFTTIMAGATALGTAVLKAGLKELGADVSHAKVGNPYAKDLGKHFSQKNKEYMPVGSKLWSMSLLDILCVSNNSYKFIALHGRDKSSVTLRFSDQSDCDSVHHALLRKMEWWLTDYDAMLSDNDGGICACNLSICFIDNQCRLRFERPYWIPLSLKIDDFQGIRLSSNSETLSFVTSGKNYEIRFQSEVNAREWMKKIQVQTDFAVIKRQKLGNSSSSSGYAIKWQGSERAQIQYVLDDSGTEFVLKVSKEDDIYEELVIYISGIRSIRKEDKQIILTTDGGRYQMDFDHSDDTSQLYSRIKNCRNLGKVTITECTSKTYSKEEWEQLFGKWGSSPLV